MPQLLRTDLILRFVYIESLKIACRSLMVIPHILSRRRKNELERSLKITDIILHTFVYDVTVPRFHQRQSLSNQHQMLSHYKQYESNAPLLTSITVWGNSKRTCLCLMRYHVRAIVTSEGSQNFAGWTGAYDWRYCRLSEYL